MQYLLEEWTDSNEILTPIVSRALLTLVQVLYSFIRPVLNISPFWPTDGRDPVLDLFVRISYSFFCVSTFTEFHGDVPGLMQNLRCVELVRIWRVVETGAFAVETEGRWGH